MKATLEGHANLARLKVAVSLGILNGRRGATTEDWELAGVVTATSVAVREWMGDRLRVVEAERRRSAIGYHVSREVAAAEAVDDARSLRRAKRVAKYVAKAVDDRGHATKRDIDRGFSGDEKQGLDDIIALALERDWIRPGPADGQYLRGGSQPAAA
jgi:hypothetical protein